MPRAAAPPRRGAPLRAAPKAGGAPQQRPASPRTAPAAAPRAPPPPRAQQSPRACPRAPPAPPPRALSAARGSERSEKGVQDLAGVDGVETRHPLHEAVHVPRLRAHGPIPRTSAPEDTQPHMPHSQPKPVFWHGGVCRGRAVTHSRPARAPHWRASPRREAPPAAARAAARPAPARPPRPLQAAGAARPSRRRRTGAGDGSPRRRAARQPQPAPQASVFARSFDNSAQSRAGRGGRNFHGSVRALRRKRSVKRLAATHSSAR